MTAVAEESYIDEHTFRRHLNHLSQADRVAVDTEGTLNHPNSKTWGLSTSVDGISEYFAFNHRLGNNLPKEWLPQLAKVIESRPCLVFHNAKHDLRSLRNLGINYTGKFYDTMIMTHMINENLPSKSLDYVSKHYGGDPKRKSEVQDKIIKAFGWQFIPSEYIREYAANDAYITDELFQALWPEFVDQEFDGELWEYEQGLTRALMKIEDNGILVDTELSQKELERGLGIMSELQKELGFNPASTLQLGKFLLEDMGLPPVGKLTPKGKPSFNKENMKVYEELLMRKGDQRAGMVLTYRGWQKTTSSNYKAYLELLDEDGKLHPNFKQHGTRTVRLSCEHPNLQQIPRQSSNDWNGNLKAAFITEKGRTAYEFDYSQLEFRLGAAYGQVRRLIDIFSDAGRDVFSEMSADLGFSRQDCKTLTYTIQFGGGAERISEVFGVSSPAANAIRNKFYSEYAGLKKASDLAQLRCKQNGYVKYWTKRRRHFPNPQAESHKAFNAVCQGGAFEIVKRATVELDRRGLLNSEECKVDLQVHDSIRADIVDGKYDTYVPEIREVMENVNKDFGVPFRVDVKEWNKAA